MEKCNQCGAERVLNPKTGKMFCKEKCWLKPDASPKAPRSLQTKDNAKDGLRVEPLQIVIDLIEDLNKNVKDMINLMKEQINL